MSASDRIIHLYRAIENQNDDGQRFQGSISWINLGGPPSVQDVAESLILVRQRGASLPKKVPNMPGLKWDIHFVAEPKV
jgi:hypothetical protein